MLGGIGVPTGTGGIHLSVFLVVLIAGVITALFGIMIGLPFASGATTSRSSRLGFGEILPQIARNGDNPLRLNIRTVRTGSRRSMPRASAEHHLSNLTGGILPAYYLNIFHTTIWHHTIDSYDLFFWTTVVLLAITVFCFLRLRDSGSAGRGSRSARTRPPPRRWACR